MECAMVTQGYKPGSCLLPTPSGPRRACELTLKREGGLWHRLIASAQLSRPEDYYSIYQSGCNHSCLKCHSWYFTQRPEGFWASTEEMAEWAATYELTVTVREPRERATMWHATDLCHHCGSCVRFGVRGPLCPKKLKPDQIVLSSQGYGPARNIVSFTGGDLLCRAEFYAEAAKKIKEACTEEMWILLETNGYGLTPSNLDLLASAGVDSFWLDLKAYDEGTYRKLCGTTNEWILKTPAEIRDRGFVLELLSLYIPGWVEEEQLREIAELIKEVDPNLPFTLLAFFPEYKLSQTRSPSLTEMLRAYLVIKEVGLKRVKLGNCHVFAKSEEDWTLLMAVVGPEGIG
ncbi:MAG: radical SAM protein [Candidatus Hadarchaeales archaeon]